MRRITLINAFYRNASMLRRQYENIASLPDDLKQALQYIVVDDASPKGFRAEGPEQPLGIDFELYRINKKKPWNWMSARNIGAHHAKNPWLLFTDMDHVLPEGTLRRIVEGPLKAANVYRFSRVDAPKLTTYKPHPNTWLMTAEMYSRFGGFDERWAGCYGSDFDVRDRLTAAAKKIVMLEEPLVRYPREVIADASTTDFARKNSEFSANIAKARERIAKEGGPPLRMSFSYQRIV
jgi:hypothetical protein